MRSHTHTQKGEAGRGDAEERPKYDKERRGRGGIEPHLERQTTASPKSQGSRDEREREREAACAPLGEQALSLAACFCFITGLVVEYGISDRLYPDKIKTIKEPRLSLYCEGKRCIEFLPS